MGREFADRDAPEPKPRQTRATSMGADRPGTSAETETGPGNLQLLATLQQTTAADGDQLDALAREAARRRDEQERAVSTAVPPGPSQVTVPVEALLDLPMVADEQVAYGEMLESPDRAESIGTALGASNALHEYVEDKLDLPITIELQEHDGAIWFVFSACGNELFASTVLSLPVDALDAVSTESLQTVTARAASGAAQITEAAVLETAFTDLLEPIARRSRDALNDLAAYSKAEIDDQALIADRYFQTIDALVANLTPANDWLRDRIGVRRDASRVIRDAAKEAQARMFTYHYHQAMDLEHTAGEAYASAVEEAEEQGGILGWGNKWSAKGLDLIADIVTLGGSSLNTQNARLFRAGLISWDDFTSNRLWNIGRVGIIALVTALTAGRASGLVLRLLGLEAGTAVGAATVGVSEGAFGGFAQTFSSDVYAKAVAQVSGSSGVRAFHESTIAGPSGWATATAVGGGLGVIGGVAAHVGETRFGVSLVPEDLKPVPEVSRPASSGNAVSESTTVSTSLSSDVQGGTATSASSGHIPSPPDQPPIVHAPSSEPVATSEPLVSSGPVSSSERVAQHQTESIVEPTSPGATPDVPAVVEPPAAVQQEVSVQEELVVEQTPPEPETTDVDIAGDERIERIPGNARLRRPSTGERVQKSTVFEEDSTVLLLGGNPSVAKTTTHLPQPTEFSGRRGLQSAIEPDFSQSGTFAEFKDRNWNTASDFLREGNVLDLAGSLEKIFVADQLSGVSQGGRVRVVTSRRMPLAQKKAVLRELRRWLSDEWGVSNRDVGAFLDRIDWTWRRPKLPR